MVEEEEGRRVRMKEKRKRCQEGGNRDDI